MRSAEAGKAASAERSRMRWSVIRGAVVVVLLAGAFALGRASTETRSPDGAWWKALSPEDRTTVVVGLVDGYSEGYYAGYFSGENALFAALAPSSQATMLDDGRFLQVAKSATGGTMSKPFDAYVESVTRFYDTYPALADIPIGRIFQCMVDHPTKSCADYADNILKARAPTPSPSR